MQSSGGSAGGGRGQYVVDVDLVEIGNRAGDSALEMDRLIGYEDGEVGGSDDGRLVPDGAELVKNELLRRRDGAPHRFALDEY